MEFVRSKLFRVGYFLYTNTSFGYYYHQRNINAAKKKFGDDGQHSVEETLFYDRLSVTIIPYCLDNYCYIVTDVETNSCIIIDPGCGPTVLDFFRRNPSITPSAVLCTHKHWDHCSGTEDLLDAFPHLKIYASEDDGAYLSNANFRDSEILPVDNFNSAQVIGYEMPGHTVGHAIYHISPIESNQPGFLFTGDCLFLNGIGKMFECSSFVMNATLQRIVDKFPDDSLVFPGHEYTLEFIRFTLSEVEPENEALKERLEQVSYLRSQNKASVPASLGLERQCNPFLRTEILNQTKKEYFNLTSPEILDQLAAKKVAFSSASAQCESNEKKCCRHSQENINEINRKRRYSPQPVLEYR
jgi:hydroxyacylglutathione hydrolase